MKRSNGSASKRKRIYANVKSEELDSEIIRAEKRLYYLRSRRKKSGVETPLRKRTEEKKEHNADYVYYKYWVKDRNFTQKYIRLREDMVVSAKHFVAYHNRIMKVVNMFGSEQEKAALKAVLGNNQEELKM